MSYTQQPVPAIHSNPNPAEEMGLIQGMVPMSWNEWFVSLALDKLKRDYSYQYQLGSAGSRGSQKIDFVVWTPMGGIPCYVQGAYWHDLRHDPDYVISQAEAARYFGNEPVLLLEEETDTKDKAYQTCLKKLGAQ
jgi:hypothetical protein